MRRLTSNNINDLSHMIISNVLCYEKSVTTCTVRLLWGIQKQIVFLIGGGKAGKYPDNFCGRRDIHLAPEARIATMKKQVLEGKAGEHFLGLADYMEDGDEVIEKVIEKVDDGFAFMLSLPEGNEGDAIGVDEEVTVNTIVCNAAITQSDSMHHDTGASCHIFHKQKLFHNYTVFESPLAIHGFGTSLTTQAVGKGRIVLKSTYDGTTCNFSVSNVLHIPTAQCSLIFGTCLDQKGVNTQTGNSKITHFNAADIPFATGSIMKDLYKMDVKTMEPGEAQPSLNLIAGVMPSVKPLFGPGTETPETQKLGFITV